MRILHILNNVDEIGNGIVNATVDLACSQVSAGHEVHLCSAGGDFESLLQQHGVIHHILNQRRQLPNIITALRKLIFILKEKKIQILHAHMITGLILGWTARYFVRIKLISTVHNEWQKSAVFMGLADRVICVSPGVLENMHNRGIPRRKLVMVLNGCLGSLRKNSTSTEGVLLARPAIISVAGMYKRKGIRELITAFQNICDQNVEGNLYLIGDGPDIEIFRKLVQSTYSERIHFLGFKKDPDPYLKSSDIFVLASKNEPFGLAVIEARAAGCAIVVNDIGGLPETVDHGKAGILTSPQDINALTNALRDLLLDENLLEKYKRAAKENLNRFTTARMAQETTAAYEI